MRLQKYDIDVQYERGSKMYIGDMLSRAYLTQKPKDSDEDFEQVNMASFLPITDERLEEIRRETNKDQSLQILKSVILKGWPEQISTLSPQVLPYFSMRDKLTVQDGIVFRGERVVIPTTIRSEMKKKVHSSHMGIESTLSRARKSIFWPGMLTDIKQMIEACETCCKFNNNQQKEPLMTHDVPHRPWEKIGTDLFELNNRNYLIPSTT